MKGLKKIALATAIAAAPFASHAGMQALDDTAMGNVTGQAGVTIELETKVSIGEFRYTDTDGYDTDTEGGSFVVSDVVLGGAGVHLDPNGTTSQLLDDLAIEIDVAADGDAVIHVASISGQPIDWGVSVGSIGLQGADKTITDGTNQTTLISGLSGYGNLGQLDIRVDTLTDQLQLDVGFNVIDMDFDVSFLGIGIRDMAIMGGNFFEEAADPNNPNPGQPMNAAGMFAVASVDVYKGSSFGDPATAKEDVLRIDVDNITMDMNIGGVEIGGTSIGSVALDNLTISDTRLAVYGR